MKPLLLLLAAGALLGRPSALHAQKKGPTVREVHIERQNVFNPDIPGEDWQLFRLANRIHLLTRKGVVAREVLLPPGSTWDPVKALEIERNLRSLGFIRDAEVRATPVGDGRIDLDVRTQDSWTLQPTFSVGTEGGKNTVTFGVIEDNLLGLGKSVGALHSQEGSQRRRELNYSDPRIWGTRNELTSLYASANDGDEIGARLGRPFFSFATPYATDVSWSRVNQIDTLYKEGDKLSEFNHNFHTVRSEAAHLIGDTDDWVHRLHLGTIYERQRFFSKAKTLTGTLPEDRTLSGPIAGYSCIEPQYLKETNIDKMHRVEDFNLGTELAVGAAPILKSWGSDRDRMLFSARIQRGLALRPGRFILAQVGTQGRVAGGDQLENSLLFANLNIFWKHHWPFPQTFVGHLEYNNAKNLDGENQLILGGNTGLRGYKSDSFTGARSFLLNIEDRFFYDREILHLLHIGGALFFDIGTTAKEGASARLDQFKSDIGAGLRISGSRSSSGGVLRIDIAYALNSGPGRDRWVASVQAGQAFSIFNSTNKNILRQPDNALAKAEEKTRLLRR